MLSAANLFNVAGLSKFIADDILKLILVYFKENKVTLRLKFLTHQSLYIPAGTQHQNDVVSTSMRRDHVASTLIRRHFNVVCPLGYVLLYKRMYFHTILYTVSRYLKVQETLWNTSRYPYHDISDLHNEGANKSSHISQAKKMYVIWLLKLGIYCKYCGKEKKLFLRSNFSPFPQYFVTCC